MRSKEGPKDPGRQDCRKEDCVMSKKRMVCLANQLHRPIESYYLWYLSICVIRHEMSASHDRSWAVDLPVVGPVRLCQVRKLLQLSQKHTVLFGTSYQ